MDRPDHPHARPRKLAALALLCLALPHAGSARGGYTFTIIVDPADPTFNQALGINAAGQIAGYFGNGTTNPNKGYTTSLANPTTFTNENFPGSLQTQVTAINAAGDTAGFWVDTGGVNHGFTLIGGTFKTVDNPGGVFNQLLSLNNTGYAAGFLMDAAGNSSGYLVHLGASPTFTPVAPPVAAASLATGVNDALVVAGTLTTVGGLTEGYLYDPTTKLFTYLNAPGAVMTQAFGLNNHGQVVGDYVDGADQMHGFIYQGGLFTTLDAPHGLGTTTINGINDLGQVVGFYVDANGNTIGFAAVPVPEPSSLVLTALGAAACAGFGLNRRRTPSPDVPNP